MAYQPGALLQNNNLSDVASASSARTNLGLGTAAVLNAATTATANALVETNSSGVLDASFLINATGQTYKQGIVNGALQVWQRGTSFTGIAGSTTTTTTIKECLVG